MIVAIVGPTASGKSDLALHLAKKHDGEIICADSRTIYRHMDIGTAKPTAEERTLVPHHLLDVVNPGEFLSAAEFKRLAVQAIREIKNRGRMAILVGGSGLYIDSVLFDYQFPGEANDVRRSELESMDDSSLIELLEAEDSSAFARVDLANRRRVIRAIETAGQVRSKRDDVIAGALVLGMQVSKEVAHERIEARIVKMLGKGSLDEVAEIGTKYGWDTSALEITGYKAFKDVALGAKSIAAGQQDCVSSHMALYKKQVTWFKRNRAIHWIDTGNESEIFAEAERLVEKFLPQ